MTDTDDERKAWKKACARSTRLRIEADYAAIRSEDDQIADAITDLVEYVVRYNRRPKDYDRALWKIVYVVHDLMRDQEDLLGDES